MSSENSGVRCVAVVDVLGFKERLKSQPLAELAETMDRLSTAALELETHWAVAEFDQSSDREPKAQSGRERVARMLFSDSVVLWSPKISESEVCKSARIMSFVSMVAQLLGRALYGGIPLRAGLAFGEVLVSSRKRILVGQPVVDAYQTEGVQEWVGGALHSSMPFGLCWRSELQRPD
jgi:hypothetical protein